jgi:tRNA(Ile2) C34 agmatinyltransferase TiaS
MTKILIAIDDTDNLQSRGTGHCARTLAERLEECGLAKVSGITRHQLYVHELIPYTSHNSAACLLAEGERIEEIIYLCGRFLINNSAKGSDAGLCVVPWENVTPEIESWGAQAKKVVLTLDDAIALAQRSGICLKGFTGTHGGMIGALAAVGLRKAGNDGRFLMVKGMRKKMGVMTTQEILEETGVEEIVTRELQTLTENCKIMLDEWWRPILKNNRATLIVDKVNDNRYYEYRIIPKNILKELSA